MVESLSEERKPPGVEHLINLAVYIAEYIAHHDADKQMSMTELVPLMTKYNDKHLHGYFTAAQIHEKAGEIFKHVDKNGDQHIDGKELLRGLWGLVDTD